MSIIFSCLCSFVLSVSVLLSARVLPFQPAQCQVEQVTESVEVVESKADPARELLERLEAAHAAVTSFSSPLTYRKEYALEGDHETRLGEVALRGHGIDREIVLFFELVIDASGHGTDDARYHVYKDGWWTEVNPGRKQVLARQMQPAGSIRDPFDLGEGPLPLPIGQKASRVLARFEVRLGEKPDDIVLHGITDPHVLHLEPRAGTPAAEDIESIDLLYDRETLLPVGLLVVDRTGDRTTAWLRKPRAAVDDTVFAGRAGEARTLIERAGTDSAWTVDRKPLPTPVTETDGGGS